MSRRLLVGVAALAGSAIVGPMRDTEGVDWVELVLGCVKAGAILVPGPPDDPAQRFKQAREKIQAQIEHANATPEEIFDATAIDSGARNTANIAIDLGRTLAAVPGRIDSPQSAGTNGSTVYEAVFFQTYSPSNALQIVQRVPSFTLDIGAQDAYALDWSVELDPQVDVVLDTSFSEGLSNIF